MDLVYRRIKDSSSPVFGYIVLMEGDTSRPSNILPINKTLLTLLIDDLRLTHPLINWLARLLHHTNNTFLTHSRNLTFKSLLKIHVKMK